MIDFKWENGMYTVVDNESQWNEVVESMKACGFKRSSTNLFNTNRTLHILEVIDNEIFYMGDNLELDTGSQFIELDELEKSSQSKPYFHSTDFTVELVPPFWDGEGAPKAGMMVDVEETYIHPTHIKKNVKLKYLSEFTVVYEEKDGSEISQPREVTVFHKPTVEYTPLEKLQEWCTNNQRALGVDHLLEEMLKQELIDLSMLDQITGD